MKGVTPNTSLAAYKATMAKAVRPPQLIKIEVAVTANNTTYTFQAEDVVTASKVDDIDPLSRRLPTQTFSFTAADPTNSFDPANPSGCWAAERGDKVTVWLGLDIGGTDVWADPDYYYLTGRPAAGTGTVVFQAEGRIATLDGHWGQDYGTPQYATAVSNILTNAGVAAGDRNLDTLELNRRTGIASESEPCTHAEALQRFAHASGMALYSRDDKVCMQRWFDIANPMDFSGNAIGIRDVILNGDQIVKTDPVKTLRVTGYQQVMDTSTETIWEGDIYMGPSLTVQVYHFTYGGDPFWDINVAVSGGAVLAGSTLGQYEADVILSGSGTAHVVITGSPMEVGEVTRDFTIGTTGATEELNNPLIGFEATTAIIRDWLIDDYTWYLAQRVTHSVKHRGTTLIEPGDLLTLTTERGTVDGLVLAVRTDYNGAVSSTLTIKEIS